jgi:hypothetical protein
MSSPEPCPSKVSPKLESLPSPLTIISSPEPSPMKVSPELKSLSSPLFIMSSPEPSPIYGIDRRIAFLSKF